MTEPPPTDRSAEAMGALAVDAMIERTAVPILELGRGWMADPGTASRSSELGLEPPFGFWVNGRAGVLGDVHPDVAAAAIGFMAPQLVGELWTGRPAGLSPLQATTAYAEAAAAWGRETLAAIEDEALVRLTELSDRVTGAALPSCGVLFAGWRGLPKPADPAGAATVALNVLRELRGGAHLSAVHAVGLGPHGAIIAADDPVRGGEAGAQRFGWVDPHPAPDVARRAEAERLTTVICRPAYEALVGHERAEFVELVSRARSAMDDR